MDVAERLRITDDLEVPRSELSFRATRAGGPGGQHVNTSATRVELTFDVATSPSLSDGQRARLLEKLANRLDSSGVLRLVEGGSRSQLQNKEAVMHRFQELLREALHVPKPRRKTRPPRSADEARLKAKRQRSATKQRRGPVRPDE